MCDNENTIYQEPLDFGDKTVPVNTVTERSLPASQRFVRNKRKPYPCEDPAQEVHKTDHLRPKQELSYFFNEIIRIINISSLNGFSQPQYDGQKPLQYCEMLFSSRAKQNSLLNEAPKTREEKLKRYFIKQPNLEISLSNFLYWLETENFIIDSVTVPEFSVHTKDRDIIVTRSTCDAIQLFPKHMTLFSEIDESDLYRRLVNAKSLNLNSKDLIVDLKDIAEFSVLEFKIGHPDNYSNTSIGKHREQIRQYIHRINKLTNHKITGRLIYFSDREGQKIFQEIYEVEEGFWDTVKTIKI